MERSIYRFILKYSKKEQVFILLLTFGSMPPIYFSLELPKRIINDAISGINFPKTYFGVQFDQFEYLIALCMLLLALILLNGGLKFVNNVYRGILGERMLRRLRYQLYRRILRFPLPHFKNVAAAELIPMITAEIETLGGFIADAFALPAFQGGLLITYLFFIFNQDLWLGLAAVVLYPPQMYLIPKLQRRVNQLGKRRVLAVRTLSQGIGETVAGINEIHAHDTSHLERASFASRLAAIYHIRYEIYRRKFFIKFLNNFLAQVTPFFFYMIGGYFVIAADLSLGALVAVLAAYKDLSSPWKELLRYYQQKEDVRIKYEQVIEKFQPADMMDEDLQDADADADAPLSGEMVAANLSLAEDESVRIVDGVSFAFDVGHHVAIIGASGSGREELGRLLARLTRPTGGQLTVGGSDLAALPEAVTGRRFAYVGQGAYVFTGSVRNNLYYGLKHRPLREPDYDGAAAHRREREVRDAQASGNPADDVDADWIDYAAAGVADAAELEKRAIEVLALVDMEDDVYRLGLRGRIDPVADGDLAQKILEARVALRQRTADPAVAALIEPFDAALYNGNATVAENLLFGTLAEAEFDVDRLARHAYVLEVLGKADLLTDLITIGRKTAETMVELFSDLPPGHEFFEQYAFIGSDDLPEFQTLLQRIAGEAVEDWDADDRSHLLSLAFKLAPARHRLGLIDERIQERVIEARRRFAEDLPEDLDEAVHFFDAGAYNASATVQDNILFGKLAYGQAQVRIRVGDLIGEVLESLHLRRAIIGVGLEYAVGIAGARLSPVQRQKLAIARCLLKRPDALMVNKATAILDSVAETRLMENVVREMKGRGLIWVLDRAPLARYFDRVLVMDQGKVVEHGPFEEIEKSGPVLRELLQTG